MNIKEARRALERFTWETEPDKQPPMAAALIRACRIITVVTRDTVRGELRLHAMGLVYASLLALIPLLAVIFAVLKAFGAHDLLKPMLLHFLAPLEQTGVELTRQILQFVSKMRVGVLGTVGVGLLLYTSVSLIRKVEQALNGIWHVRRGRRWVRRMSDYLAVIVIGPLLFFTALGVTASLSSSAWLKPVHGVVTVAAKLLPYLLVIGAHALIYLFIPNTKVHIRSALLGATVAGVLWQTAGFTFAAIIAGSGQYRAIYASLAILIFFMIWLYLSWLIVLIGASIAHYQQYPERATRDSLESGAQLSIRRRERLGLLIAHQIADYYYAGREPWTAEALARRLQHPVAGVEQLLAAFTAEGLLVGIGPAATAYLPKQPLETVPLRELMRVIRSAGSDHVAPLHDPAVDAIVDAVDTATAQALAGRTWRDLVIDGNSDAMADGAEAKSAVGEA